MSRTRGYILLLTVTPHRLLWKTQSDYLVVGAESFDVSEEYPFNTVYYRDALFG